MEDPNSRASSQEKPAVSPASTPDSAPKPLRRRHRVPIACASCRLRKTKCEHIAPRNNLQKPSGQDAGAYDYIRSLEDKVKQYEAQLRSLHNNRHEPNYQPATHNPPGPLLPAPTVHNIQQPITLPPLARSSLAPDRSPAAITAASPLPSLGGDGTISFTQLILNAMNTDAPSKVQSSTQFFSSTRDPSREMPDAKLHDLPPDVRELVQRYFDFHHVLTPIFHVPSTFPRIDQVLNMDRTRRFEDPLILAMINMICAISAAHRWNGFETSTVQTRKYYDRAMTLVGPTVLFDCSNFPDESWTLLGLAIRIAYGLELHRPPPENLDCIQKEVRKRLWYACYMTDQLASTICGRPVSTASNTFTTPLPEDLDDDSIHPSQLLFPPTPILSTMSHSIQGVKLCRIMESALTLVDPPLEKIVELDEQFEAWDAQLPSAFRIYEHESVLDDKKVIMAMRANMTRILIHRHSVVKSLSVLSRGERLPPLSDGLRANMMQNSRHICVRSAEDTIQLVGCRHDTTKTVTGPSWLNLYYLFNAILIIASHVVDPDFRDDKEALAHLEDGMRMIAQLSAHHTTARRAHIFLRQLLDLVEKVLPQQSPYIARKLSLSTTSTTSSMAPQTQASIPTTAEATTNGFTSYSQPSTEFIQLWESTVDLTTALGSELDYYSSMGSGIWSWGNQAQDTRPYAAIPQGNLNNHQDQDWSQWMQWDWDDASPGAILSSDIDSSDLSPNFSISAFPAINRTDFASDPLFPPSDVRKIAANPSRIQSEGQNLVSLTRRRNTGGARADYNSSRKRKTSSEDDGSVEAGDDSPPESKSQPSKKHFHNVIEKRYRANLNEKITELRDSIPSLRGLTRDTNGGASMHDDDFSTGNKLNKASILSKATEYIRHLEFRNSRLEEENKALENKTALT
ncbi:hypothetical protein ZTR_09721 [Talaromyces verruculosus]|nr:hypothetical protein ZTR_09721 [Talaromyces verruculosus]